MQENSVQNQSLLQKKEDPELPDFLNWKPRSICEKSPLWGNKPGSQLCHRKPGINCSNTRSRRGSWDGQTAFCSTGVEQDPLSVGFWGQQIQLQGARPRCQLLTPRVPRIVESHRGASWEQNKLCLTLSLSQHPRPGCPPSVSGVTLNIWAPKTRSCICPFSVSRWRCKRMTTGRAPSCSSSQAAPGALFAEGK